MKMIYILFLFISFGNAEHTGEGIREIEYNGKKVRTTFSVDSRFLGKYQGRKAGFLELKADGTGYYRYDIFGFALEGCTPDPIKIEWGFLVDENDQPVKFDREYGHSYPILMKSVSKNSFNGCRKQVMLDFIIEKESGLHVSSSDDWKKQ